LQLMPLFLNGLERLHLLLDLLGLFVEALLA
jgi:hypothetical protein